MSGTSDTNERPEAQLRRILGSALRREVPLAPYTTLGIGGPGEWLAEPERERELAAAVAVWPATALLHVLGEGSNLLIPDQGMPGLVIHLGHFRCYELVGTRLRVGAGHRLPNLVNRLARAGLSGLEPLVGVPGSVGGAVVMNAGTRDGTIGDHLEYVTGVDREGRRRRLEAGELAFGYRRSRLQQEAFIVTEVVLQLARRPSAEILRVIRADAARRRRTQPLEHPNAGSIFCNPPGEAAGRLLDLAGCKGLRVGAAMVSGRHANFIVNEGEATAAQVIELMVMMWTRVRDRFGIELAPELRLWGELPDRFRRLTAGTS